MGASPYTDLDRPPLRAESLRRALIVPGGLWTRLDVRAETGSTNADAVAAARDGAPEGLVVVAERQTAGRGRLGRLWESPARAGLAVSVVLRPACPTPDWPAVPVSSHGWLPLLAGVAVAEAVSRLAEVPVRLKWPNDLLVEGRKCGGILAEAVPATVGDVTGATSAVVVGMGLNVTLRPDELPHAGATSLSLAGAACTDRDPLLRALLRGFATWYGRWRATGGDPEASGLRAAYVERCVTLGQQVRVALPADGSLVGTATTVDADGRLLVRTAEGTRAVAAGDVVHVRPGPASTANSGTVG